MNLNSDWLLDFKIDNTIDIKDKINSTIKYLKKVDVKYKSTRGILSEQYDLLNIFLNEKDYSQILDKIKQISIKNIIEKKMIKNVKDLKLINAWTVSGYEGSYHELHNHCEYGYDDNSLKKLKKNQISTVLYLNVDNKSVEEKRNEGYFYFIIKQDDDLEYYNIKPETGKFLVFPIWIFHGTYPQSNGLRQTLNLDFEVIE